MGRAKEPGIRKVEKGEIGQRNGVGKMDAWMITYKEKWMRRKVWGFVHVAVCSRSNIPKREERR